MGKTRNEFENQYLCTFEMSKEDTMLHDRVERYLIESADCDSRRSEMLAKELKQWCGDHGISNKKLNAAKIAVGRRI